MYEEFKSYNIVLNEQQLSIISNILIEAPYKLVAPIITHINSEIKKSESAEG
jgi:hypothetical protein